MTIDHEAARKKARFWDQWSQGECRLMAAAYLDLATQLEAAKKDAARYRWVLGKWTTDSDEVCEEHDAALNAHDPDAAIDAAIKEGK